jgi:hypothetical protein
VTCSISPTATLTAGGSASATLTISAPADTANLSYNVTVTGTDSTGADVHTVGVVAQVSGSPAGSQSFFLANNTPTMNLTAGSGTGNTSTVTVTPLGGFSGTVALSCTVGSVSGGSTVPICSFSSSSATISGTTSQTSTLIVNTRSGGSAQNGTKNLFWPSTGGAVLAVVLFFGIPRRRRNWLAMLGLLVVIATFASLGCGTTFHPPANSGSSGTSAGSYVVTVTGTSGSITQTTTVNVTVAN